MLYLRTFFKSVEFRCFAGLENLTSLEGLLASILTVCALLVPGPEKAVARFLQHAWQLC